MLWNLRNWWFAVSLRGALGPEAFHLSDREILDAWDNDLTPRARRVLCLRFGFWMGVPRIARRMGRPNRETQKQLKDALEDLRRVLRS